MKHASLLSVETRTIIAGVLLLKDIYEPKNASKIKRGPFDGKMPITTSGQLILLTRLMS